MVYFEFDPDISDQQAVISVAYIEHLYTLCSYLCKFASVLR